MDLHHIREEYSKRQLAKSQCAAAPLTQFRQWLNEAIQANVNEPTAMNVATVENGKPVSRVVLLKEVNEAGFVFFTNYQSRKGRNIDETPYVALNFFWPELERQVRIEGGITAIPEQASTEYFHSRPYTSQIGAWASEQSQPLKNKQALLARAATFALTYPLNVPKPPHWGGYLVRPEYVEFWQGRPSRLHDRICYQKTDHHWQISRLSP